MTEQDQIIEQLRKELAEAKSAKQSDGKEFTHYIKVGQKRGVVFGGTGLRQRPPVTLYAPGMLFLLDHADEIREFIEEHKTELSWER